ncbi:Helix-turn-helix domain protein [Pseudoalteromonas sp. P1-25]|nr:Helix-turn-helix domain protein [Pseudoalteromonas sp. P1-25]
MNHYEKGRHTPDLQTLKRLAEKLGVPLNYFFCETEDMAELVLFFNSLSKKDKIKFLEKIKLNDNV